MSYRYAFYGIEMERMRNLFGSKDEDELARILARDIPQKWKLTENDVLKKLVMGDLPESKNSGEQESEDVVRCISKLATVYIPAEDKEELIAEDYNAVIQEDLAKLQGCSLGADRLISYIINGRGFFGIIPPLSDAIYVYLSKDESKQLKECIDGFLEREENGNWRQNSIIADLQHLLRKIIERDLALFIVME